MTNWGNTSQGQNPGPARPVYPDRSDRSQQRLAPVHLVRQEYRVKEKKDEPVPMQVDSEKVPAAKVVQVEDRKEKAQDAQEGPVIVEKLVNVSQKLVLANDHETSSSHLKDQDKEKYFQSRRLQHLRRQEQKEKEAEKLRDEIFDECRPRFPQGKMWQVKTVDQPTGPVGLLQPTGQTGGP